jgi:hypothetical protein
MVAIDDSETTSCTSERTRLIAAGVIVPRREVEPEGDSLAASLEGRPCLRLNHVAARLRGPSHRALEMEDSSSAATARLPRWPRR